MLKILFIEDDSALKDKLSFILEAITGIEISTVSNFSDAQKIFNQQKNINLIIADYRNPIQNDLELFQTTIGSTECIICIDDLNDTTPIPGWKIIEKVERKTIATNLKEVIEKTYKKRIESQQKFKYCKIKTLILLETSPLNSDIYAKLSETKYIKVFLEGDIFDAHDFKKYTEQKKIDYLFLREDNCKTFINKYISKIEEFTRMHEPPPFEQLVDMNAGAYESVKELTDVLGFSKEVQQLAKSHVQMTVQFMDKKPNLNKILSKLKTQRGKYMADHCYLLSYISCGISANLEWGSESTYFKLALAAFLHDITISDEKMVSCTSVKDAAALGLPEKELNSFKSHPFTAAELVRKMSEIPPDVDVIIFQHHELPDGTGFPRAISANHISPLSAVFIIAQDMVKNIFFPPPGGFILNHYLEGAQLRFHQSSFKRVISAARKIDLPD